MHGLESFLEDLALVLCAAALAGALFQRLRQPAVLGYLLAGLVIGPNLPLPLPLVANLETVHTLAELGVILLMFSLGLEFSVRKLVQLGGRASLISAVDVSLMLWLGFLAGKVFGWGARESLFAGAIVAISSTMIVARAMDRAERRLTELVFGILIFQDLAAILLLALLSAVAQGSGLTAGGVGLSALKLLGFLLALLAGGLLTIPRFLRFVVRTRNRETMLVATVGISFALALLARGFGYSVALGAFLAGSLAAESGEGRILEPLVRPLRDMFASIFFVAVGMLIDPAEIARHWQAILALTAVVLVGKTVGIGAGSLLTGHGLRGSVRAGMSLAQIGEFSFLIAGVGLTLGEGARFLFPVALGVCVLTTFTTPLMVRLSGPVSDALARALPRRLGHFGAAYAAWLEGLGRELGGKGARARLRRLAGLALVDAALLVGLVISVALSLSSLTAVGVRWTVLGPERMREVIVGLTVLGCLPFAVGLVRCVRQIGTLLALEVLPQAADGTPDLAAAPRRAFVVGLQVALLSILGAPMLALTQPFLPALPSVGACAALLGLLALFFWRGATNLDGHMRAGAEMIVEILARQSRGASPPALDQVRELLPGLGALTPVAIEGEGPAVGRSLAQLDLRGRTGAAVVCIHRGQGGIVFPNAAEAIRAGDVLVLSGCSASVDAARAILGIPALELVRAA